MKNVQNNMELTIMHLKKKQGYQFKGHHESYS